MLRNLRRSLLLLPLLAACSGKGTATPASVTPHSNAPGSVHIVFDPATGSDVLVQFEVVAAALERDDGSSTGNLLAAPTTVTFADPSGELDGFVLGSVPTGDYTALHLLLPSRGQALYPDGSVLPITSVYDLVVPIADGLQHSAASRSWLAVGHNGVTPPLALAADRRWVPALSGRVDGSTHSLRGLRIAAVQSPVVVATAPVADEGPLQIEFAAGCVFDDHRGGRDDFLRGSQQGDELSVDGSLFRDGRFVATHVRRDGRGDGSREPRLIGRIREVRAVDRSFVLHVLAEVGRRGIQILPRPANVLVDANAARIVACHQHRVLAFGDLATGQLVKVKWSSRTPNPGRLELVVASEIEVALRCAPMRPEWQGLVQSVDVATRTIVVVPRNNDPIVINGGAVRSVDVHVAEGVPIVRRERRGGGRANIELSAVQPGSDRIWWAGDVTGIGVIEAAWVRVRTDD